MPLPKYSLSGGGNGKSEGTAAVGTLLGPEGAEALSARSPVERRPSHFGARAVRDGRGERDRPYLENCTVDASIFVAKLVRAHGGCLGTRSR